MTLNVSIVIPTFNRCHLVSKAIDSALAQTHPVEVILCDHASRDATPEIASGYGSKIRYVRREIDRGPVVCWRDAIENASGDIVHITYDDDWIDPTFIERTLPLLRDDVAFVYTQGMIHVAETEASHAEMRHPPGVRSVAGLVQHLLRSPLTISPGCALFRKKDLLKNLLPEIPGAKGLYGKNSGVGEDLLVFLLCTLDYPKYAYIPEPLAHFLAHPTSITTNAGTSGRMDVLVDAYALARKYYLAQPGSIPMADGVSRWLARKLWKIRSARKTILNAQSLRK